MGRREHADRSPQLQPIGLDLEQLRSELIRKTAPIPRRTVDSVLPGDSPARFILARTLSEMPLAQDMREAYELQGVHLVQPRIIYVSPRASRQAVRHHFSEATNDRSHMIRLLETITEQFGAKAKYLANPIEVEIGSMLLSRVKGDPLSKHSLNLSFAETLEQKHLSNELRHQRKDVIRVALGNPGIRPAENVVATLGSFALHDAQNEILNQVNSDISRQLPVRAMLGPLRVLRVD